MLNGLSQVSTSCKANLEDCSHGTFIGNMPFLTPSQQCESNAAVCYAYRCMVYGCISLTE